MVFEPQWNSIVVELAFPVMELQWFTLFRLRYHSFCLEMTQQSVLSFEVLFRQQVQLVLHLLPSNLLCFQLVPSESLVL